jgi:F-box-like
MSITYLPVEVLEMIFDRGCETDRGYDGLLPKECIKPKLKSFARNLIQVCQRWRSIVLASRRYWITVATLYFDYDSPSKVVQSLIQFNRALHSANGSDIDIVFESTRSSLPLELNRGNLLKLRSLGLFLHGMLMSLDYIRYWRLLYAYLPAPEPLEFLLNMLCSDIEPKRFDRLIGMAIYSDNTQPLFPNKLSSNYFPLFSLLMNNAQKPANTGLRVSGLGLILPSTFRSIGYGHLRWLRIGGGYPDIEPVLSETLGVRTLVIVEAEIHDKSFDSSSAIVVPNITALHLMAAHFSILSMCRFPFLQILRLNFHRNSLHKREGADKGTHWHQFPLLHSIYLKGLTSPLQFHFLMSRISAPKLVTFEVTTELSLQVSQDYIKELRSRGSQWPNIFKAPKVLKLSGHSSEMEFFLRRMQLDAVQEISLFRYYDSTSRAVNLAPPIAMPALEMLSIDFWFPISRGNLFLNLEAPALNSLTLSRPITEQTEYNNSLGVRLFKSITHLSIQWNLPFSRSDKAILSQRWASTVIEFPGITRLTILVDMANNYDIVSTLLSVMNFIGELEFRNIRSVQIHLMGEYASLFHLNSQVRSVFLSKLQGLRYSGPLNHIDIKLECDWCRPEYGRIERADRRGSGIERE